MWSLRLQRKASDRRVPRRITTWEDITDITHSDAMQYPVVKDSMGSDFICVRVGLYRCEIGFRVFGL